MTENITGHSLENSELKVFTMHSCPNCPKAKELCKEIAAELNLSFKELNLEEHLIDALQLQIASVPSIIFNDTVISISRIPSKQELIEKILSIRSKVQ